MIEKLKTLWNEVRIFYLNLGLEDFEVGVLSFTFLMFIILVTVCMWANYKTWG